MSKKQIGRAKKKILQTCSFGLTVIICLSWFFSYRATTSHFLSRDQYSKVKKSNENRGSLQTCLHILAIGGSVTAGSAGFSARHPDSPKSLNDSYPKILEDYINKDFPCTQSMDGEPKMHKVVNLAIPGCSAKCHLTRWAENYAVLSETKWDLVIIEPTANTPVREMNHLRALIAAFEILPFDHPSISIIAECFIQASS